MATGRDAQDPMQEPAEAEAKAQSERTKRGATTRVPSSPGKSMLTSEQKEEKEEEEEKEEGGGRENKKKTPKNKRLKQMW